MQGFKCIGGGVISNLCRPLNSKPLIPFGRSQEGVALNVFVVACFYVSYLMYVYIVYDIVLHLVYAYMHRICYICNITCI